MKPLIGITLECRRESGNDRSGGTLSLNWNYAQRIADLGGVPLLVPPQADMAVVAELLDGWLIPGGYDIDAARFGQENHPKAELQDPERYRSESELLKALPADVPILGICYGCQFLNVARGGTLVQHLPDVVGDDRHSGGTRETNALDPDSHLMKVFGAGEVEGLSFHHQACGDLGEGLRAVSRAPDGTIEAIEATDRPWVVGVQWHPERLPLDPTTQRLFEAFVARAAEYRQERSR